MVAERDPARKPAQAQKYCAECNSKISQAQAKNSYVNFDTPLCGNCVETTCKAREEAVPGWNERPEEKIQGWTESELAHWALKGAEFIRAEAGFDIYKIPEPMVPEGAQWAGFEHVDRDDPVKILRHYMVPRVEDNPTDHAAMAAREEAQKAQEPPKGSLADRMRSQEPDEGEDMPGPVDPAEDPDSIAENAWRNEPEEHPAKVPDNEWTRAAGEMRKSQEPQGNTKTSPSDIQDAEYSEVPAKAPAGNTMPATRQAYAPPQELIYKGPDDLSVEVIQRYVNPDLTAREAYEMLMLCKYRRLNPFTREVYAIKYKGKNGQPDKCELVVGKDAFTGRAEQHPAFDGYEAGIIVQLPDGSLDRRAGTFTHGKETLVGGWAKVYRKDRSKPYVAEVSLQEYRKNTSIWQQIPATMIRKVALVQALREAFPSILGGLYDSAEIEKEGAMIYAGSGSAVPPTQALPEGVPA